MNFGKNEEKISLFTEETEIPRGAIAFFDSGIGGLALLNACKNRGLCGNLLYYGDNAHAPYGNSSEEEIFFYAEHAFDALKAAEVAAAVIACNTVTAVCLEKLRKKYAFPIYATRPPLALAATRGGETFVFATRRTIESREYIVERARTEKAFPNCSVRSFPLETLAGKIERHVFSLDEVCLESMLPFGAPNSVVLGCTHYSFLKDRFRAFYRCPVYDSSEQTAKMLCSDTNFRRLAKFCAFSEKEGKTSIFFVGSGKNVDKTVYEQMFVHN